MKKNSQKTRRLNPLSEARPLIYCFGLAVTLFASTVLFAPPKILQFLDHRVYDLILASRPAEKPSDVPVLIGIDDQSLESFGQWPWPRYRLAQLVSKLKEAGVDAVALDMLMPEPDRTSLEIISQERTRDLAESEPAFSVWADGHMSNDLILANAMNQAPVVISYKFLFSEDTEGEGFSP